MRRRTFIKLAGMTTASMMLGSTAIVYGCADGNGQAQKDENQADTKTKPEKTELDNNMEKSQLPASTVYFTREISPESLTTIYKALDHSLSGNVAVKISTGEPGGHNFLQPALIKDLVDEVSGTIVECNTAYGGKRSSTQSHLQAAADHGFTAIADVVIMDADGEMALPVEGGSHLTENYVGAAVTDYDSIINLAHFKGHAMAGYGGVIKNSSIGIASARGKMLIHSGGASGNSWSSGSQDDFLDAMGEAAKSVADHYGDSIVYINVMNNLSVDCDCDSHPADPEMEDIGILASLDPVALDQASIDLIYAAPESASLIERIESRNGLHTLEYAEQIGLGSREYELIEI